VSANSSSPKEAQRPGSIVLRYFLYGLCSFVVIAATDIVSWPAVKAWLGQVNDAIVAQLKSLQPFQMWDQYSKRLVVSEYRVDVWSWSEPFNATAAKLREQGRVLDREMEDPQQLFVLMLAASKGPRKSNLDYALATPDCFFYLVRTMWATGWLSKLFVILLLIFVIAAAMENPLALILGIPLFLLIIGVVSWLLLQPIYLVTWLFGVWLNGPAVTVMGAVLTWIGLALYEVIKKVLADRRRPPGSNAAAAS
jgi:hypothetical protein